MTGPEPVEAEPVEPERAAAERLAEELPVTDVYLPWRDPARTDDDPAVAV